MIKLLNKEEFIEFCNKHVSHDQIKLYSSNLSMIFEYMKGKRIVITNNIHKNTDKFSLGLHYHDNIFSYVFDLVEYESHDNKIKLYKENELEFVKVYY